MSKSWYQAFKTLLKKYVDESTRRIEYGGMIVVVKEKYRPIYWENNCWQYLTPAQSKAGYEK